jgi:hypothetical protein
MLREDSKTGLTESDFQAPYDKPIRDEIERLLKIVDGSDSCLAFAAWE